MSPRALPHALAAIAAALLLAAAAGLAPRPAAAQQITTHGVTLHYAALPSTALDPAVATRYGVTRSAERAVFTLVARRDGVSLPARITGTATNEAGVSLPVAAREVRDGADVSQLAQIRVRTPRDMLRFQLQVEVAGAPPIPLVFRQAFFQDPVR